MHSGPLFPPAASPTGPGASWDIAKGTRHAGTVAILEAVQHRTRPSLRHAGIGPPSPVGRGQRADWLPCPPSRPMTLQEAPPPPLKGKAEAGGVLFVWGHKMPVKGRGFLKGRGLLRGVWPQRGQGHPPPILCPYVATPPPPRATHGSHLAGIFLRRPKMYCKRAGPARAPPPGIFVCRQKKLKFSALKGAMRQGGHRGSYVGGS